MDKDGILLPLNLSIISYFSLPELKLSNSININNYESNDFTKNIGLKIHDISTLNYSRNSVVQEHKEGGLRFDFVLTFKKVKSN